MEVRISVADGIFTEQLETKCALAGTAVEPDKKFEAVCRYKQKFYGKSATGYGPMIEVVTDDGELVFIGVIQVNGNTGKASIIPQTVPTVPLIEQQQRRKRNE